MAAPAASRRTIARSRVPPSFLRRQEPRPCGGASERFRGNNCAFLFIRGHFTSGPALNGAQPDCAKPLIRCSFPLIGCAFPFISVHVATPHPPRDSAAASPVGRGVGHHPPKERGQTVIQPAYAPQPRLRKGPVSAIRRPTLTPALSHAWERGESPPSCQRKLASMPSGLSC